MIEKVFKIVDSIKSTVCVVATVIDVILDIVNAVIEALEENKGDIE